MAYYLPKFTQDKLALLHTHSLKLFITTLIPFDAKRSSWRGSKAILEAIFLKWHCARYQVTSADDIQSAREFNKQSKDVA